MRNLKRKTYFLKAAQRLLFWRVQNEKKGIFIANKIRYQAAFIFA